MEIDLKLFPELGLWNDGKGIDIPSWFQTAVRSDAALAYLQWFWPTFVETKGYILRSGVHGSILDKWEADGRYSREAIEQVLNTIDIIDQFTLNSAEETTKKLQRCRVLAHIIKDIYSVKLRHDFPSQNFMFRLTGVTEGLDDGRIAFTFWHTKI